MVFGKQLKEESRIQGFSLCKIVDKLNDSYTDFEQKLKLLKSSVNCKRDQGQLQNIIDLVEKMEGVDYQLKTERAYIADLEMKIQQVDSKRSVILKQKSKARKDPVYFQPNRTMIKKSIEVLKQKLHAASVQLSGESTKNVELREKIRSLMSERKCFNKNYNKLIEKLQKGKKILEDLYVSLKNADLARQNIMTKIETIGFKEEKQKKLQEEEALELEMHFKSENEWLNYYHTKIKSREKEEDEFKKIRRLTFLKYQFILGMNLELLCNIYGYHGFTDSINNSNTKNDVIKIIKRDDLEIEQLFKYVTQLRDELEALQEKVFTLVNETEEKLKEYEDIEFLQVTEKVALERKKQKQIESEFNMADDLMRNTRDMNRVYKGIEQLVKISKADVSPLLDLLGYQGKVTDFNYLLFLQALESRINFLMDIAYLSRSSANFTCDSFKPTRKIETPKTAYSRRSTILETKVTISRACPICHPSIRSRKSTLE
uniref:ODAD1 central coiled coil region domain-containing protein n=1 Tax=Graphocephala atropunctata TaxID=36148 RepID=A0A1B6KX67_9HEMI